MIRIIGGEYRGRILKMPRAVRPTQDKVREAVFNIIRERIPGNDALDLYAGSGAFGIEALSRGAQSAIFVDNNINSIKIIKSNLLVIGDRAGCAQVFKVDAVKAITKFGKNGRRFDIIFLDPPYHGGLARNTLIKINACDILAQRGFVIAEHFKKEVMPQTAGNLSLFKERRYGDTMLSFFTHRTDERRF